MITATRAASSGCPLDFAQDESFGAVAHPQRRLASADFHQCSMGTAAPESCVRFGNHLERLADRDGGRPIGVAQRLTMLPLPSRERGWG